MKTALCFGEALIDFHALAPVSAAAPPAYLPHPGGAPANVAVALARLGFASAFIGMLGADAFGDLLLDSLRMAGVDTRHVRRTDRANTALAFVSLDARGERSFSFYRPPAADLLFDVRHFAADAFADAALFHVCSNSLTETDIAASTLEGMARARAAGALVSFDMNLRPALWRDDEDPSVRIWPALHAADVVKLSAEERDFLVAAAGDEGAFMAHLWRGRTRWLIVTDGSAAIHWYTPLAHGRTDAFDVPVTDSTGAGDAFMGGLLHGLASAGIDAGSLDELTATPLRRDRMLRFAAACGALAVTRTGSFDAMPTLEEVQAFLRAST